MVKLGKYPSDEELLKEYCFGISPQITPMVDTLRRVQKDPNFKNNYVASVHEALATWNEYQAKCQMVASGGRNRRSASAFNSNHQKRYHNQNDQNGQSKKPRFNNNHFKPENKSYTDLEWGNLSYQQRKEVIKLRKSRRGQGQANSNARKIVSSAVLENVNLPPYPAGDDRGDAANQFGRKAYRK